jgi:riboflavin synthase
MFTGLIEATGRIDAIERAGSASRLVVAASVADALAPGDSISVNGVCLTATSAGDGRFAVDVSPETLRVTAFGVMTVGRPVNLERPLRAEARLGGHFVLGHVDAVGRVRGIRPEGEHHWIDIEYPAALAGLLVPKGSIAVDGISLTVAALAGDCFGVQVIPFTWTHTAMHAWRTGDPVNLEGDVLGKYVARLLETQGMRSA